MFCAWAGPAINVYFQEEILENIHIEILMVMTRFLIIDAKRGQSKYF